MKPVALALALVSLVLGMRLVAERPSSARADDVKRESAEPAKASDAKAEQAKTEDANGLMAKGRALSRAARALENPAEKAEYQKQARECFAEARDTFQANHDRYKKSYDKYDKFIPKTEKETYDARELAYRQYIQAQLHLAVLLYEEAQSWEKGSPENKKLLTAAAEAFDKIHAKYRQMLAGLYARMWQGKCYEEQDDIVKALGLYNELLGHGGGKPNAALADLQDRVRHFRLICLNRDERKDHQIVVREAEEWLEHNKEKPATSVSLGIQWELARALEFQAHSERTSETEKSRLIEKALATAREINRQPGEYKDVSDAMIQRLKGD